MQVCRLPLKSTNEADPECTLTLACPAAFAKLMHALAGLYLYVLGNFAFHEFKLIVYTLTPAGSLLPPSILNGNSSQARKGSPGRWYGSISGK